MPHPESLNPQLDQIDWTSVNQRSFYTQRGDVSSETNEATIYTRKELPFVIKTFVDPEEVSVNMAILYRLDGLVPRTIALQGITIRIDNRSVTIGPCLIQEKISVLDSIRQGEFNATPERLTKILEEKAELDREIFRRDIFLNDPKFMNYGLDNDGKVKVLDVGSATDNPFDDDFLQRFLIRGVGHYFNYLSLQVAHTGRSGQVTQAGIDLSKKYESTVGLTFDQTIGANQFLTQGIYLYNVARYYAPSLVRIAVEDVEKNSQFVIPQDSLLPQMAQSSIRDWAILPGGNVGYMGGS